LGKTLIILALITLQRQNAEKIFARDEALFPLDDVRAHSTPLDETGQLGHSFSSAMIPPFYHDGTQGMFRTKATLVLCPSHLAKQWETEVGKHTNPALKVRRPSSPAGERSLLIVSLLGARRCWLSRPSCSIGR
jgi:hypothetical protein